MNKHKKIIGFIATLFSIFYFPFSLNLVFAQEQAPGLLKRIQKEFRFTLPRAPQVKTITPKRQEVFKTIEELVCPLAVKILPVQIFPTTPFADSECGINGVVNSNKTYTLQWLCSFPECVITKNGQPFLTIKGSSPFNLANGSSGRGFIVSPVDEFPPGAKDTTVRFVIQDTAGPRCKKEWSYDAGAPVVVKAKPIDGPPRLAQHLSAWFKNENTALASVAGEPLDADQRGRIYLKDLNLDGSVRLRVAMGIDDYPLNRGQEKFKLQYALTPRFVDPDFGYHEFNSYCRYLPDVAYRDLSEFGIISFFDNRLTPDGSIPQPSLRDPAYFAGSIPQIYAESNPFTTNNTDIPAGGYALFDFALEVLDLKPTAKDVERFRAANPQFYGGLAPGARPPRTKNEACFRMVRVDNRLLDGYNQIYPSVAE